VGVGGTGVGAGVTVGNGVGVGVSVGVTAGDVQALISKMTSNRAGAILVMG
jgi:hypothetical protein